MFFETGRHGSEVLELVEEALDKIAVPIEEGAEGGNIDASRQRLDVAPSASMSLDPNIEPGPVVGGQSGPGSALQSGQIDAHADFTPFAELFSSRGFARKIFDGSQAGIPTFHGILVDADYAGEYPEIVIAYLRAAIEANRPLSDEPEKYSELIAKVTGTEASVSYLFHGPLGLQTRDLTWKQEYRKDVATAVETLKLLKRADTDLDLDAFITEKYIRAAFEASPSTMTRASPIMRRRF